MIILLVDKLDNRPRPARGIDQVRSCGQYPGSFDGITPSEIHATEEATRHPRFEKVAATLAIGMEKRG